MSTKTPAKKRQRMPYPAHTPKDIRVRAAAYADHIANKGTVGHESAFYDFLNGAVWERGRQAQKPDMR